MTDVIPANVTVIPAPKGQSLVSRKADVKKAIKVTSSAMHVVQLARRYTARSIEMLGETLEDDQQPIAVRIKCAELLLDRAYGKAPQAVLVADAGSDQNKLGVHALPILERIRLLKEAKNGPVTTDLEASELTEVSQSPDQSLDQSPAQEDII